MVVETENVAILTKRCSKCGVVKPHDSFYRNASRNNRLMGPCKECRSAYQKWRYANPKDPNRQLENDTVNGEYIELQFESLIRELATVQYQADRAKADTKRRIEELSDKAGMKRYIEKLNDEADRASDDAVARGARLRLLLTDVCKRMCEGMDTLSRGCKYGSVQYVKDKLDVTLHPRTAWADRDKL